MSPKLPLEFHPDTELFPLLEGGEFDELKQDIAQNGLQEPIWLDEYDRIVDGRNRYRAWRELHGKEPIPYRYVPDGAAIAPFVLSLNIHRRDFPLREQNFRVLRMEKRIADEVRDWERDLSQHVKSTLEVLRFVPNYFRPSDGLKGDLEELVRLVGELSGRSS